jgi:hypothetical protein
MRRVLHPWNSGFLWPLHGGPLSTITAEQAREFDELGYFVVEHAFDAATIARTYVEPQAYRTCGIVGQPVEVT